MEATVKKSKPVIMPDRVGLAENKRQDWVVDVPVSVTLEQAMEPSYWAHVAELMEPLDHIELRCEDGSWVADLIVQFCERNYARVVLKNLTKLEPVTDAPANAIDHKVQWKGPVLKFCVIRVSDDKIIKQGIKSKPLAYDELQEHEKSLRR